MNYGDLMKAAGYILLLFVVIASHASEIDPFEKVLGVILAFSTINWGKLTSIEEKQNEPSV